jgi:hypothetical protein
LKSWAKRVNILEEAEALRQTQVVREPLASGICAVPINPLSGSSLRLFDLLEIQKAQTQGRSSKSDFYSAVNRSGAMASQAQIYEALLLINGLAAAESVSSDLNRVVLNHEYGVFYDMYTDKTQSPFAIFRGRRSPQLKAVVRVLGEERVRQGGLCKPPTTVVTKPINQWDLEYFLSDFLVQYAVSTMRKLVVDSNGGKPVVLTVYSFALAVYCLFEEQKAKTAEVSCSLCTLALNLTPLRTCMCSSLWP